MVDNDPITTSVDNRPGQPVVIHNHMPKPPWLGRTFLKTLLFLSLFFNFIAIGQFQSYYQTGATEKFVSGDQSASAKVAIIKVDGMITDDSIKDPKKELETAAEDDGVKAVVLSITSPGGTISASDELYHSVEVFKEKTGKPVVVSMIGLAASGGYYVAMPADKIYADRSCITGSIGVIAQLFDASKLAEDWGVKPETIKSGPFKDSGSMLRPLRPEERENWQAMINAMQDQFVAVILKYREKQIGGEEKLRELANGKVYLAGDAKETGLIDEIGYRDDAVAAAAKLASIEGKPRVITYQRSIGSLMELLRASATPPSVGEWAQQQLQLQSPRILLMPDIFLPRG